jgi:NADH-quinone oxidoreductase subunit J
MSEIAFYALAGLTVVSAMGVVLLRNPVHCALSLVVTLFLVAIAFVGLEAHLVAALQIIIYAGAVMVLFLFVIMLLNLQTDPPDETPVGLRAGSIAAAGVLGGVVAYVAWQGGQSRGRAADLPGDFGSTVELARVLFKDHLVAFELTSLLLLVAVVGAVVLARRDRA